MRAIWLLALEGGGKPLNKDFPWPHKYTSLQDAIPKPQLKNPESERQRERRRSRGKQTKKNMAESVRMSATGSSLRSFSGSRRPIPLSPSRFLLPSRHSSSSYRSEFVGNVHLRSRLSKASNLQQQRGKFSVFAMAADGISLYYPL